MNSQGSALFSAGRALSNMVLTALFVARFLIVYTFNRDAGPRVLRQFLERRGAGFVKLGQLLAMRWDLLPARYCEELTRLLDRVEPLPASVLIKEIEHEFGRPIRELFVNFEPTPLGSASLAQVHGAELPGGCRVAVKVLRPGIDAKIRADLALLRALAAFADGTPLLGAVRARQIVEELRRFTLEELDLRREARSAHTLHELMENDELDHCSPRVYFERVSARVLTMERFDGVAASRLIAAIPANDTERLRTYACRGITPKRTARLLFRSIMRQAYVFRTFHADPHSSNLIILEGGTLAFIDFGIVGWLDEHLWAQQYRLFRLIGRNELHQAYLCFVEVLKPLSPQNLTDFESEFKSLLHDWMVAAESPHATSGEKSTGRFLFQAIFAIRRAGLTLPVSVLRLHRTTIVSDMVELQLYPALDIVGEMRDFFEEDSCRQLCDSLTWDRTREWTENSLMLSFRAPTFWRTLMEWVETRLPEIARSFEYEVTRLDLAVALAFRYARVLVLLSVPLVTLTWLLGSWLPPAAGPPYSWLRRAAGGLNFSVVVLWFAAAAILSHVLQSLSKRLGEF